MDFRTFLDCGCRRLTPAENDPKQLQSLAIVLYPPNSLAPHLLMPSLATYVHTCINPWHACAARVKVFCWPHSYISVCVCLSVTTLAKVLPGSTLRQRYVQCWNRLLSVLSSWIFKRNLPFKSYGIKKPIC